MIKSNDNSKIKLLKSLKLKKNRDKYSRYVVEGEIIVYEYLKKSHLVDYIIYNEKYLDKEILLIECEKAGKDAYEVEDKLFKTISDTVNSQGIIAVINKKKTGIDEIVKYETVLFLDNLQDPGNMGTMIRSCDAFGKAAVIINKGCTDVYNAKSVRASMGSLIRVPLYVIKSNTEILNTMKENGYTVYCTDLSANKYIRNMEFSEKKVIVIGNESKGVSEKVRKMSDELIKIRMSDNIQSLNASIAASICLYEIYSR